MGDSIISEKSTTPRIVRGNQNTSIPLSSWLVMFSIFFLPFSTTALNVVFLAVSFCLSIFSLALRGAERKKFFLSGLSYKLIFLYLFSFLVGVLSIITVIASGKIVSFDLSAVTRLLNLLILTTILLSCLTAIDDDSLCEKYLLAGYYGLFVFFIFALWQVISLKTPIPFPFETRDWMHGVPAYLRSAFPTRITSIAEEPSFFSPLILEFIILHFFIGKDKPFYKIILYSSILILFLTFSAGAYINATGLLLVLLAIYFFKRPTKGIIILLLLSFVLGSLIYFFSEQIFLIDYITEKLTNEASGGSSRSQFMNSMFSVIYNSSATELLIGHGLTSMSHLEDFGMPMNDVLFRISNNLFVDVFWESGALGLVSLILLFKIIFFYSVNLLSYSRVFVSISFLFCFQLLITSMYRSEYVSSHFIFVLLMIVVSLRLEFNDVSSGN